MGDRSNDARTPSPAEATSTAIVRVEPPPTVAAAQTVLLPSVARPSRAERRANKKRQKQLDQERRLQALASHPELVAAAREAGLDDTKIADWIQKLAPIAIGDAELVKIGEPEPATPVAMSATRRQLAIRRHQLAHWLVHGKGVPRLFYGGFWLSLLWGAVMKSGLGWWGYVSGAVVLGVKLTSGIGEMGPKNLPLFQRTQNERSLLVKTLLERVQQWPSAKPSTDQLRQFQVDALRVIALLVRDHRADLGGRRIFVSLLVTAGDRVEVIARANDNRPVPMQYTKEQCSIAWEAFTTGVPQVSGDLRVDAPATADDKSYQSVMAIPVKLRDRVLAVVSIDSELRHHFHGHFDDLQTWLGPYVKLVASALLERHDRHLLPSPAEGA